MKKIIIISIFTFIANFTSAQDAMIQETVHLKNGNVIKGMIIEEVPNQSIKIKTEGGSLFVLSFDEIAKITKDAVIIPANEPPVETKQTISIPKTRVQTQTKRTVSTVPPTAEKVEKRDSANINTSQKKKNQYNFGFRGGIHSSLLHGDFAHWGQRKNHWQFHLGVIYDVKITNNFYIQPGLYFIQKGGRFKEEYGDFPIVTDRYNISYLEIPVLASYRYNFDKNWGVYFNAGPYFSYAVKGKNNFHNRYWQDPEGFLDEYNESSLFDDDEKWKRHDFGLSFGIGLNYSDYIFEIGYDWGLLNISNRGDCYNRSWLITLGVNFKLY